MCKFKLIIRGTAPIQLIYRFQINLNDVIFIIRFRNLQYSDAIIHRMIGLSFDQVRGNLSSINVVNRNSKHCKNT